MVLRKIIGAFRYENEVFLSQKFEKLRKSNYRLRINFKDFFTIFAVVQENHFDKVSLGFLEILEGKLAREGIFRR